MKHETFLSLQHYLLCHYVALIQFKHMTMTMTMTSMMAAYDDNVNVNVKK